jgi:hypothetical protein
MAAAATAPSNAAVHSGPAGDPFARFTSEGQDPTIVHQAHARASEILTTGETLLYVAIANKGSLTHAPDCVVATNKRIMLYRKKVLGKLEQDDFYWRDVRHAALRDGRGGVTFEVETIQGWQMAIESLPKNQAGRLYDLAVQHSEKLAGSYLAKGTQHDLTAELPDMGAASNVGELPPLAFSPAPVPNLPAVPSPPRIEAPATAHLETASLQAPEPAQPNPTPESVLQAILQQAARNSGAPTRPMPLSAAAFQAPVADPQPVTLSEANTDQSTRSMPRLSSLEQIAVFSGPLSGRLSAIHDSVPLSPYEPRLVQPARGASSPSTNGNIPAGANGNGHHPAISRFAPEPEEATPAAQNQVEEYGDALDDGQVPLPGSRSSGPLLEAMYDNGRPIYSSNLVSGSLETQELTASRLGDMVDRITSTNLAAHNGDHNQTAGRTRRPVASAGKSRQAVAPGSKGQARSDADDPVQKMTQLKAMLDAGLIEREDYEAKKADILSRL